MADALRGSMDAAEYKHVVLGLIFLKYISDAFEEAHAKLEAQRHEGADPEHPDEYRAQSIFWVPPEARWSHLQAQARQPTIGRLVDDAMAGIERDNPALKEVLPKDYARPALDKSRLGRLIDLVGNIKVGDAAARSTDVLGRVYEYFLAQFASAEGKKGGEFYTPRSVVELLVAMLEPYRGRVYDPCCGSSGMFVQAEKFIRAHASGNGNGGRARADISIYGQESNYTTWRLAKMNLAIRGIEGHIRHGDSFHNDRHPDLRADFILANPPFNVSDWGGERLREDKRWQPRGAAKGQRQLRLGAAHGPPPGAQRDGGLRPGQRIDVLQPVGRGRDPQEPDRGGGWWTAWWRCLGSSSTPPRSPPASGSWPGTAGAAGSATAGASCSSSTPAGWAAWVDRTHRELTEDEIARIAAAYHAWRGGEGAAGYADESGFCKSASLEEVRKHGHVLTPGRYVGAAPQEDDGEPFAAKMARLAAQWREQQAEAVKLDAAIAANLEALGYGIDGERKP